MAVRIKARNLIQAPEQLIWERLKGKFILEFDDGEIETTGRKTILSWYGWVFHRMYPELPILKKHHAQPHMPGGDNLTSSTFVKILEQAVDEIHKLKRNMTNAERINLNKVVQQTTNDIYNVFSEATAEYVSSVSIMDILEIMQHPEVVKIKIDNPVNIDTIKDEGLIGRIYKEILQIAKFHPDLKKNPLSIMLRCKLIKEDQFMQCVGPRGSITDMGSELFPHPVSRGYVEGFRRFHDSFAESRTAAMSLNNSKAPLKNVEYFSRKVQLVGMQLERLHHYDCGSELYTTWQVNSLSACEGKYYLDSETNTLKYITMDDKHLLGRYVKMRTLHNCMCEDPNGVCAVCFGELSRNIYQHTNLGHICTVTMTAINSQLVLSTKHVTGSATASKIVLDKVSSNYFTIMEHGFCYGIAKGMKNKGLKIAVPDEFLSNFANVLNIDDINDINTEHTTRIPYVTLVYKNIDGLEERVTVHVEVDHNLSFMTTSALKFFRKQREETGGGWYHDESGNYVFDMEGWDYDKPFLELPAKQFNTYEFSKDISKHLESKIADSNYRDKVLSPTVFLQGLYDLVSERMGLKLSVLEGVAYSVMTTSFAARDFALPKPWTKRGIGVLQSTMMGRSMAPALSYQNHKQMLTRGETFMMHNVPDHPFDSLYMPAEVMADPPPTYSYLDVNG